MEAERRVEEKHRRRDGYGDRRRGERHAKGDLRQRFVGVISPAKCQKRNVVKQRLEKRSVGKVAEE